MVREVVRQISVQGLSLCIVLDNTRQGLLVSFILVCFWLQLFE